ncbi:MAG: hypothetical protein R3B70_38665 [Polyangiaceae bacterium]
MSIKPHYAFRLLSGQKRVEFRRRAAAKKITHIVVYATKPVGAVVGVLEISDLAQGTPQALWRSFSHVGGIQRGDFFDYFSGSRTGVAYVVGKAWSCAKRRALGQFGLPSAPPQALQYLSYATVKKLGAQESRGAVDFDTWLTRYRSQRS